MPKVFATENQNKVPAAALWMTNIVVQLFVITTYWSSDAFTLMLNMTSVMALIPFLLVAAYGILDGQAGRDLRDAAAGAHARPDLRRHRGDLHPVHDLRRRHEVPAALGGPLRARHRALHLGAARAEQASVHAGRMGDLHRRDGRRAVGIHGLATGYITI